MIPRTLPLLEEAVYGEEEPNGSVVEFPSREKLSLSKASEEARMKNTEAQRRFRARMKASKLDVARKLEEVNAQLHILQREKQELESDQGRIKHILEAQVCHIEQLFSYREVRDVQQQLLLKEMALLMSKTQEREVSLEEATRWTLRQWVQNFYQEYMSRVAGLYNEIMSSASPKAWEELQQIVALRHEQEKAGDQFSCMGWSLYCWNLEETQKLGLPPPQAHWQKAIEGLRLTTKQKKDIVQARSSLFVKLRSIALERSAIVSRLGIQLLDYQREQIHLCPASKELRESLEKERTAVYTFLVSFCDSTLTALQEVFLDNHSWPWCADLLQIADLLAAAASADDAEALPPDLMDFPRRALAPIAPKASAFQVLVTPMAAAGTGFRCKRGIALNPVYTVESQLAFPHPSQELLQHMSLEAVHTGAWKQYTFWEWSSLVRKCGQPFPNTLRVEAPFES